MNKDEILIVKTPYRISSKFAKEMHEQLIKQKESGVIILPYLWSVEIAPSDFEIEYDEDEEAYKLLRHTTDPGTPWEFIENEMYSPFDGSKEKNLICSECRRRINRWNEDMVYCHYCGKRHYFNKERTE